MQFFSQREYLKQLNIQRYYVNKFRINFANASRFTPDVLNYLDSIDREILRVKKEIEKRNNYSQLTIYNFIDKE